MPATATRVMDCDREIFQRHLNVLPHAVTHNLAGHPLFQLDALVELSRRVAARKNPHMSGGDAYFNEGAVSAGTKPNYERPDDEERAAVVEIVRKIEQAEAWIILKHV